MYIMYTLTSCFRWGTLGKLQLMLRKASQALFANEQFNLEEMHNYRMAVTEREVINGCLNVDNVSAPFVK